MRDSRFADRIGPRPLGVATRYPHVSQQMIIKISKSVPLVRSDNPTTYHSKILADPGSQGAGPCRNLALQRYCVRVIEGPQPPRTLLCCHVDSIRSTTASTDAPDGISAVRSWRGITIGGGGSLASMRNHLDKRALRRAWTENRLAGACVSSRARVIGQSEAGKGLQTSVANILSDVMPPTRARRAPPSRHASRIASGCVR